MAKKLGRKSAGVQVAALAQEFADDLLLDEERAFAQAAAVFRRPLAEACREVSIGAQYLQQLDRTHRAAAALTVDISRRLGERAISKGLASIGLELEVCEKTLPTRYRGCAELAVEGATEAGVEILSAATTAYAADATVSAGEFDARARLQVSAAADVEELAARLFSEEPAGLRGFGGRGVWWWTVSDLNMTLRAVSIRCANLARVSAMQTFNEVASGR